MHIIDSNIQYVYLKGYSMKAHSGWFKSIKGALKIIFLVLYIIIVLFFFLIDYF